MSAVGLDHIIAAVRRHFDVTLAELRGASRVKSVTVARRAVIDAARLETKASDSEIGAALGRTASTIRHAMAAGASRSGTVQRWADEVAAVCRAARALARSDRPDLTGLMCPVLVDDVGGGA